MAARSLTLIWTSIRHELTAEHSSASSGVPPSVAGGCVGQDADKEGQFVENEPDYGGWFDDVTNYDDTVDLRGEAEVEVLVGTGTDGLQFDPPAILVTHLTTVVWEWTGKGGQHSVVHEPETNDTDRGSSELIDDEGAPYEYTFNHEQVYHYCEPHRGLGMKGAVTVTDM